jgi:choline kinase
LIGLVLAAGAGRRLGSLTEDLPKTLLPVLGRTSVLELSLRNLASAGLTDIVIVAGHAQQRLHDIRPELEDRCGVQIELVSNDRALIWNNAYSLWCARSFFGEGFLLCNGDTLHPGAVEHALLSAPPSLASLALDTVKSLAEEEMKVELASGAVRRISKSLDPALADGEYIGVALIGPDLAAELTDALRTTFERDPQLYYEDAFQELADRGVLISGIPVSPLQWVEVDSLEDLLRARELACRY